MRNTSCMASPHFSGETIHLPDTHRDITYLQRAGELGQSSVLYLHGIGCSPDDFVEAATRHELAGRHLLALGLPGSGGSPYGNDERLGIRDLAHIIDDFVRAKQLRRFTLVAHSMGVAVALRFLEQERDAACARFVAVEPTNALWGPVPFRGRRIAETGWEQFRAKGFDRLVLDFALSSDIGFRRHAEVLASTSPRAYFDYCASLVAEADSNELLPILGRTLPDRTTVIYGTENKDSTTHLDLLTANNIRTVGVRGHHFPFYDDPDDYYRALGAVVSQYLLYRCGLAYIQWKLGGQTPCRAEQHSRLLIHRRSRKPPSAWRSWA